MTGWGLQTLFQYLLDLLSTLFFNPKPFIHRQISFITSSSQQTCKINSLSSSYYIDKVSLSHDELKLGCKIGLDSWADTCCAGKHAYVDSFIEGKTVTASGFSSSLPTIADLPIANVKFAYDSPMGSTYILSIYNAIYLGDKMENSLLCPNQCREAGVIINDCPHLYDDSEKQVNL